MDREAEDFFWWGVKGGMEQGVAGKNNPQHKQPQKVGGHEIQSTGEKRKEWIQREIDKLGLAMGS